jgi:4-amino-4-deoxy-L-arabinose transferase-like glycosyltransferase
VFASRAARAPASGRGAGWLVFLAALGLRLLYLQGSLPLLETRQTPIYGDAARYYVSGLSLVGARAPREPLPEAELADPTAWSRRNLRSFLASRGPGYPLALAASFALFGDDPWPVRTLQALLGALACTLTYRLGRELADARVGLLAGLLAALHPTLILFSGRMLSEALATFLFAACLAALAHGLGRGALRWICVAGLAGALAALTRPTLLAAIPFLVASAILAAPRRPGRGLRATVFALLLLAPVVAWSAWSYAGGARPIAGGGGGAFHLEIMRRATLPELGGWSPDRWVAASPEHSPSASLRRIPAAANLVFFHLWFLDDLWREVPAWMHELQRATSLLALGGFGIVVARRGRLLLLLPPVVALAIVSVKWIEIRPNQPFLPLVFVLAALFAVELADLVRGRPRRAVLLVGGLAASAVAVRAAEPLRLARWLPGSDPRLLGACVDLAIVALAWGFGFLLFRLARGSRGRRGALAIALAPTLLFSALFAAYAFVGSGPRWRSFRHELRPDSGPVVQEIELHAPLDPAEVASALWLVDLATTLDPPPLEVTMEGNALDSDGPLWTRLFCAAPRGGQAEPACATYEAGVSRFTGALPASPQWWGIAADPRSVAGRRQVSLSLAWKQDVPHGPSARVELGGALSDRDRTRFYGPSPAALVPGAATSLYRWHVLHDWRLWGTSALESRASRSRLLRDGQRESRSLGELLDRGAAHWNVRLQVTDRSGRVSVF